MKSSDYTPAQISQLPNSPGVYQFYEEKGQLIYVGKAKSIKKRVASYFNKQGQLALKTRKMVARIRRIAFVIVNSEYEALLLENNLIKQHQPRYNVLLKDGKTYPYLCLTDERFPRLITTRQRHPSLGTYFGPFTSTQKMEQIEELIRTLYPLRTCHYNLSAAHIAKKKFKVCLEYHIGRCLGPCENRQSEENYQKDIEHVKHLLKGNFQTVKRELKSKALARAKERKYLEAQTYKEKLDAIEQYQAKSLILHPRFGDVDVISIRGQETHAFVHYLYVQQGAIIFSQTVQVQKKLGETDEDILALTLCHFREAVESQASQVIAPISFGPLPEGVELVRPQQGDKRKLLELAMKNLLFFEKSYLNEKEKKPRASRTILVRLQQDLGLPEVPMHIECFDNSNLQGTHPVAAMVCFKKGLPAKKLYRHFHIKSVVGPDDFASMKEVLTRHYRRQLDEHQALPDLILIDGGKGQLSAALAALQEIGMPSHVAIRSIAKKLELIFRPQDPYPLYINKASTSLRLLQQIRDEAHRFAIGFHRQVRDKQAIGSELDQIAGIGPQAVETLLAHFGSVVAVQAASHEALIAQVGKAKAEKIQAYFQA